MMIISLNDLQFYCYHGLFEEEKFVGGTYLINVEIEIVTPSTIIQSIEETVNYAEVYDLIHQRMMQPTELLETIAMELCNAITDFSNIVKRVTVIIKKTALPIEGFQGSTAVKYSKEKQ